MKETPRAVEQLVHRTHRAHPLNIVVHLQLLLRHTPFARRRLRLRRGDIGRVHDRVQEREAAITNKQNQVASAFTLALFAMKTMIDKALSYVFLQLSFLLL